MIVTYQWLDEQTMSLVQEFARQYGCSDEFALKYLLKIGRYPQEAGEDDEAYAARLERLPDPYLLAYRAFEPANAD